MRQRPDIGLLGHELEQPLPQRRHRQRIDLIVECRTLGRGYRLVVQTCALGGHVSSLPVRSGVKRVLVPCIMVIDGAAGKRHRPGHAICRTMQTKSRAQALGGFSASARRLTSAARSTGTGPDASGAGMVSAGKIAYLSSALGRSSAFRSRWFSPLAQT